MYSEQRLQRQPDLSRALASRNEAATACVFGRDQPDKARARTLCARVTGTKSSDARRLPGRRRSRHAPLAHIASAAVPSPNAERCRSTSENIRRAPAASSSERSLEQRASAVMLPAAAAAWAADERTRTRANPLGPRAPGGRRRLGSWTLPEQDQTTAYGDQRGSDFHQTSADADRDAREHDHLAAGDGLLRQIAPSIRQRRSCDVIALVRRRGVRVLAGRQGCLAGAADRCLATPFAARRSADQMIPTGPFHGASRGNAARTSEWT